MNNKLLIIAFAFLTGCASSTTSLETNYYVLDSSPVAVNAKDGPVVKLANVNVADYLNQASLLTRYDDQKLLNARYHHWAESLPTLIHRALKTELNQISSSTYFTHNCSSCDALFLTIEHFYPTEKGLVVLAGSYQVVDSSGAYSRPIEFSYNTKLTADGYAQAVSHMRDLLVQLAADIASTVK